MKKYLWVVDLSDITGTLARVQRAKVDGVLVRTDNNNFHDSIPAFHDAGIEIQGWRFPPTNVNLAIGQAEHVAELVELGLDGFVANPAGDSRVLFNWDRTGLADLAHSSR